MTTDRPAPAAGSDVFHLSGLDTARLPVLVAVPHAGCVYPPDMRANLRVAPRVLERLEDRHADALAADVEAAGCVLLTAQVARAYIDLNRSPQEIDPSMVRDAPRSAFAQPSVKVRGGLGLVPRRLADHGELWHGPWQRSDIARRVTTVHEPYHRTMSQTLAALKSRFGVALLIDLHSMPPIVSDGTKPIPRLVVGDRYGRAAAARICDLAVRTLALEGQQVALNHPYAGGYILDRHGRPEHGIHALQIEIDRSLYLDESLRECGPGLAAMRATIVTLAQVLADDLCNRGYAVAAE
ncbi:N-formylglutamate amidohydrolase [Blastomonas sp.]|uniref:N-formylglutamate amidohydrolase n=1 Tax=Blastomonas sp. TaxID=1909299 RepID=UPI003594301E